MISYNEAIEKAILGPVMKDLSEMKLVYQDGKIVRGPFTTLDTTSLWLWAGVERTRKCATWNNIYYAKYGFVSRNCFSCWKVFVKLDYITDLLRVKDLQKKIFEDKNLGYVGKCGPELRPYASYGGRYLAVWYAPITKSNTLSDATKIAFSIQTRLEDLGIENKVYLVRGCTEMELGLGNSHRWIYPEKRHQFEDKLDQLFDVNESDLVCSDYDDYKIKKWLDTAFMSGDPTAKDLVDIYPEDFGVRPRINYLDRDYRIDSNWVKRGKLYDSVNRPSGTGKEHEAIFELSEVC